MDQVVTQRPLLSQDDFASSQVPGQEPNLRGHLDILIRRLRLFLAVFLTLLVAGTIYLLTRHKIYEAETKIKVANKSASGLASGGDLLSTLSNLAGGTDVATEAEIINSPGLLTEALTNVYPVRPRQKLNYVDKDAPNYVTKLLHHGFVKSELSDYFNITGQPIVYPKWISDISVVKDTSIVSVKARSLNAHAAQKYANDIAKTYLERSLQQNTEATRRGRLFVEGEMKRLNHQLDQATAALAQYQKQSGLVSPDSQAQAESDQLLSLRLASDQAKTDLAAAQSKLKILRGQVKGVNPEVLASQTITENPEFGQVRSNLSSLRDQLVTLSKEYQPGSTKIRQLKQAIADEETRLGTVAKRVVTAVQNERNPDLDPLLLSYAAAVADQAIAGDRALATKNLFLSQKQNLLKYPEQARRFADLSRNSEEYARTLSLLTDKFYELEITERSGIPDAQIAEGASLPIESIYPKRMLMGLAILLGSLAIAGAVIAVVEKLDSRVHDPEQVTRLTGLPTLAAIPKTGEDRPMIGAVKNKHAFLEGFRLLRNAVQFSSPDRPVRSMVVTSSTAAEGKSTVSANLAIAIAMDGKKVVLVDCDLRRPNAHKLFDLENRIGFTSVVTGQVPLEEAINRTAYEGVSVITSGPLPPNPTEFLNSETSRELLTTLAARYDAVVIDSPPTMGISDVQVLSKMVDTVIFVVALETVAKQQLLASMDLLYRVNATVSGVVLNKLESRGGIYGYVSSHYGSYYSDYTNDA